ncbi:N-terminal acetyltransferase A, auxiliary subunit [Hesseltinella vesiculosa]|uniref:N-terminal acetyltransferase A, auxiliary subunit n=1 Tax=Hesseltinella vesiculosa TaxID=101127 RepID=A0A1X2GVT4_9FUNG|nr:N-terminal acetyltransferase A, auxiliary subunit [Hesseltinella vesiculosa]
MSSNRELPPKESATFRNVLKNYELRQYKKGLKLADSILKKYPEHGETLAMKGIFLNNLDKKQEGYELVKQGVRNDLTSHICWHVYGLMHRADKNYAEASKCYTQALKYNKNDVNILRDFAILQTQLRQYDSVIDSRSQLVQHRPTHPPHWLGLTVAYQLAGKPDKALTVLKSHEEALKDMPVSYEQSELQLYHNMLIEETGDCQAALDHLATIESKVTDKRCVKEKRALFLAKLDKEAEAEAMYRLLISENPYDGRYVKQLLALKGYDQVDKQSDANQLLMDLFSQYPRSKAIQDLSLHYAQDDSFKVKVTAAIQTALRKGVPSLFNSMKMYYGDNKKQAVIAGLVEGYGATLEAEGSFEPNGTKEPPTALLWCLYYLAQHYDFHKQHDKAMDVIEKAIAHSPTVVELYMTKGRILKHMGKIQEASEVMDEARQLDLQDRFINSKCAKYMLRANRIEDAEKTIGLFTRKDVDSLQDMMDMQCQWFMTEEGYAYYRLKNYGKALKRFHAVVKFYEDFFEDQFDFHAYCLGKSTLRAYVDMLRSEDRMRSHPFYLKAAKGAVAVYLTLADQPTVSALEAIDQADLTAAEKKKAKSKVRKANKANKENIDPTQAANANDKKEDASNEKKDSGKKKVDQDPNGDSYLKTAQPLEDAYRIVEPLLTLSPESIDTQVLAFDILVRQEKWLLALKALNKLVTLDKSLAKEKLEAIKNAVANPKTPVDPRLKTLVDAQLGRIAV